MVITQNLHVHQSPMSTYSHENCECALMPGQCGAGQRASFKAKLQLHSNILIFTLHPHRAAAAEMQRNEFVYRNVFHNSARVCLQNIKKRDDDTFLLPATRTKISSIPFLFTSAAPFKKRITKPTLSSSSQLMLASHLELETKAKSS